MANYITNIAASFSNFLNVILGGTNSMTFSSRCHIGYWEGKKRYIALRHIINFIFFIQEDHCRDSFMRDVEYSNRILKIFEEHKDD